jgi:hypothetical protein
MMDFPEELVRWMRGELDDRRFEQWVYANQELLEALLGPERALDLMELDYRPEDLNRPSAKANLRRLLIRDLGRTCRCVLMRDRQIVPLNYTTRSTADSPFLAQFLRTKGGPNGSELWRCRRCEQAWFVVLDDDADDWYFQRLSPAQAATALHASYWPPTYDEFGATFPSGHLRWSMSAVAQTFGSGFSVDVLFPETASLGP